MKKQFPRARDLFKLLVLFNLWSKIQRYSVDNYIKQKSSKYSHLRSCNQQMFSIFAQYIIEIVSD